MRQKEAQMAEAITPVPPTPAAPAPVTAPVKIPRAPVINSGEFENLLDSAKFEHLYRVAQAFGRSKLVPMHFQNAPDDCFVALQMAFRLQIDPFMLMQKLYVIQGKPGMEATLAIALANERGPFLGPIQWIYTGSGKERACTAFAVHRKTGERCETTITWATVEAEGWSKKNGSKWLTIPDQMFAYRSAMFLIRRYCPEVILGLHSEEELEDMGQTTLANRPEDIAAFRKAKAAEIQEQLRLPPSAPTVPEETTAAPEATPAATVPAPCATNREIKRPTPEAPPEREPGSKAPEAELPRGQFPVQAPLRNHASLADELYRVCGSYMPETLVVPEMESFLTCPIDDATPDMLTVAIQRAREKVAREAKKAKRSK